MGKFNWVELKALVVETLRGLSRLKPTVRPAPSEGWVSERLVLDEILGHWGPQVEPGEFGLLVDELVADGLVERSHGLAQGPAGIGVAIIIRPAGPPRTERVPTAAPPG